MDRDRLLRAQLHTLIDRLKTESLLLKDLATKLKSTEVTEEENSQFEEIGKQTRQLISDAEETERVILEIIDSNGSEESIENAERLYKRLNEDR